MVVADRGARRVSLGIALRRWVGNGLLYTGMTLIAVTTVGPFLMMLAASLTPRLEYIIFPFDLLPIPMTWANFGFLFRMTDVERWLLNSFITATLATLGTLVTSSFAAYADPHICYYHGYWKLGPEEALVIDVTPPECDYWNFQLNNHWMESLDYRYHRIAINKSEAICQEDGSVRIIVSHTDPGHPNWIQTAGHHLGTMCFRWIRAEVPVQPQTSVVKLSDLEGGERSVEGGV